jgi:hypothetical protein
MPTLPFRPAPGAIRALVLLLLPVVAPAIGHASTAPASQPLPTVIARTAGLQRLDGLVPLYWDEARGALLMEVPRIGEELLYQVSLAAGLGSNPIGLDRHQLGATQIVRFERVGPRVLLVAANYRYRARTADAAERAAVADSFAQSVLWGFPVEASEGTRVLVDATSFFLRDAHGVAERLRGRRQGHYRVEPTRSAIYLPRTRAFPRNSEIEATLTFVTDDDAGSLVAGVSPDARAVTLREHHSFVALPEAGYAPRRFDPRVNVIPVTFADYASPIDTPLEQRWMMRFRLQKKDPASAHSEAVSPIVYYVDNGAPEPIRQALIDGASWWNQAFEAAGFVDAFQVRVLPADADPMDVRYNVVHWVHRSTRGWSYGGAVVDPRTGEILKGNVLLGSLRVRQNVMIGAGLTGHYASDAGDPGDALPRGCGAGDAPDLSYLADDASGPEVTAVALARIRQLAAHEVGHTLGFEHNFAASTHGRASVMDYPAPLAVVRDGRIDLSQAYTAGIGEYDRYAVRVAYAQHPPAEDDAAAVRRVVDEGLAAGMEFIGDDDARGPETMHPRAALWDNGADAVAMLRDQMEVRRVALDRFGLRALRDGEPLSSLEPTLVPIYLHHRYQLQAALKWIGGLSFQYSVKEGQRPVPAKVRRVVPPADQRRALEAVLATLEPRFLAVPQRILDLVPPTAFGYRDGTAERFDGATPGFDPVSAAVAAADLAVSGLLEPARAVRLEQFHAENAEAPGFDEVVTGLVQRTWSRAPQSGVERLVARAVQSLVVTRLMHLAGGEGAASVRHAATAALRTLATTLAGRTDAHARGSREDIERFLARPAPVRTRPGLPDTPAGEPIG